MKHKYQPRYKIIGRVFDNKWSKWKPLFRDDRSFKSKAYAKKVMDKHNEGFGPGVQMKIKEVKVLACGTCGKLK